MKRFLLQSYRLSLFPDGHFERKIHRIVAGGDWPCDGKTVTLTYRESRTEEGNGPSGEKPSAFALTQDGKEITLKYMELDLSRLSTQPTHFQPGRGDEPVDKE
jgi:hypothetical protein